MKKSSEVPSYRCGENESVFDVQEKYFPNGRVDAFKRVSGWNVEDNCIGIITVRQNESFQVFPVGAV